MIITRKIQIFVSETDTEQKKEYIHTLYSWRDLVRKGANTVVTKKYMKRSLTIHLIFSTALTGFVLYTVLAGEANCKIKTYE